MTKLIVVALLWSAAFVFTFSREISAVGPEDAVEFADANLKAVVEEQLGLSDPTPSDMLALTELSGTRGIVSLAGLEHATNLERLDLFRAMCDLHQVR